MPPPGPSVTALLCVFPHAEFAGQPWKGGSVALVKGVKDGVINGDVGSLEAVTLDTSPYDL